MVVVAEYSANTSETHTFVSSKNKRRERERERERERHGSWSYCLLAFLTKTVVFIKGAVSSHQNTGTGWIGENSLGQINDYAN